MLEVHLDPVGGIAGDMFVAALLDFRPDLEAGLVEALALCPLIDKVDIALEGHNDGILTGRRFSVRRDGRRAEEEALAPHLHTHHHADWRLIREALVTSKLDRETVKHAIGIFTQIGRASCRERVL